MNNIEIFDYCKQITKKENVTFKYLKSEAEQIDFKNLTINNFKEKINDHLTIRVIEKGNIEEHVLQTINKKEIINGIKIAKKIARLKKSDVKFNNFGNEICKKKIKFDSKINKISFTNLINEAKENIKKEKYITGYLGGISKVTNYNFLINPYNEKENEKYFINTNVLITTKNKKASSGEFSSVYTKKEDINITQDFLQAKINAYNLLDPKNGNKGEYTLILTPEVLEDLFDFILSGTKGDVIEKKSSFLHDVIGKKIFSENIKLQENPHIDYFLGSAIMDDEGYKTTKKKIISNGSFKKPIYNLYQAIKYNKKPTGNAFSGNSYYPSYTNKILIPGTQKIDNIIKNTKKGILVYELLGLHTNDISTGDFSLTISSGKSIENGSFKDTVTNLNFTGNLKEILKNITFSKEQKFLGNTLYSFGIMPNIKLF